MFSNIFNQLNRWRESQRKESAIKYWIKLKDTRYFYLMHYLHLLSAKIKMHNSSHQFIQLLANKQSQITYKLYQDIFPVLHATENLESCIRTCLELMKRKFLNTFHNSLKDGQCCFLINNSIHLVIRHIIASLHCHENKFIFVMIIWLILSEYLVNYLKFKANIILGASEKWQP